MRRDFTKLGSAAMMVFAWTFLVLSGCGAKDDLGRARAAVESSLNQWKSGGQPQQMSAEGIEFTDPDWSDGLRLIEFSVKQVSSQPQQGPRVVVLLSLQNRAGKMISTEVAYEVLMKDTIKIGRDAFHVGN